MADRDDTTLGLTGAVIAVTAWGGTGVVIKAIDMESMSIAFYRFALYAVVVVVWMRARSTWPSWHMLRNSLAGGVCLTLDVALFFTAVKLTTIVNATIIGALQPVLVIAVAGRLFGEHIRRRDVAAAAVAVAGVVAIVLLSSGKPEWNGVGDLAACGALFAWTGYLVFSKRSAATLTSIEYTVGTALWTALLTLPIGLAAGHDMGVPSVSDWLPLAALALGGGVLGHTLMNWSLVRIPLWIGSALTLLIPVTSSLLAWVFLDESLSVGQLIAMAVVIGVLAVLVRGHGGDSVSSPDVSPTDVTSLHGTSSSGAVDSVASVPPA
jgi:drug/metabolite transporter (DMT)-like permease